MPRTVAGANGTKDCACYFEVQIRTCSRLVTSLFFCTKFSKSRFAKCSLAILSFSGETSVLDEPDEDQLGFRFDGGARRVGSSMANTSGTNRISESVTGFDFMRCLLAGQSCLYVANRDLSRGIVVLEGPAQPNATMKSCRKRSFLKVALMFAEDAYS